MQATGLPSWSSSVSIWPTGTPYDSTQRVHRRLTTASGTASVASVASSDFDREAATSGPYVLGPTQVAMVLSKTMFIFA